MCDERNYYDSEIRCFWEMFLKLRLFLPCSRHWVCSQNVSRIVSVTWRLNVEVITDPLTAIWMTDSDIALVLELTVIAKHCWPVFLRNILRVFSWSSQCSECYCYQTEYPWKWASAWRVRACWTDVVSTQLQSLTLSPAIDAFWEFLRIQSSIIHGIEDILCMLLALRVIEKYCSDQHAKRSLIRFLGLESLIRVALKLSVLAVSREPSLFVWLVSFDWL